MNTTHADKFSVEKNLSDDWLDQKRRGLSHPVYPYFINVRRSPVYEIIFLCQVLGGFVFCTVTVAIFTFIAVLVMHACGQLEIVMSMCKDLLRDREDKEKTDFQSEFSLQFGKKVSDLVAYHQRVLR